MAGKEPVSDADGYVYCVCPAGTSLGGGQRWIGHVVSPALRCDLDPTGRKGMMAGNTPMRATVRHVRGPLSSFLGQEGRDRLWFGSREVKGVSRLQATRLQLLLPGLRVLIRPNSSSQVAACGHRNLTSSPAIISPSITPRPSTVCSLPRKTTYSYGYSI